MTQDDKTIIDKAKDLAFDIKDKVTGYVGENEDKIHDAVDKTGEFIDDKTKGRFSEKIDKAQDAAKSAVTKIGAAGPESDDAGPSAADSPSASDAGTAGSAADDVPTPPTVDPDAPAPE